MLLCPARNSFWLGPDFFMQLVNNATDFFSSKTEIVIADSIDDDFERISPALDRDIGKSFLTLRIFTLKKLYYFVFLLAGASADKIRPTAIGTNHFDILLDANDRHFLIYIS